MVRTAKKPPDGSYGLCATRLFSSHFNQGRQVHTICDQVKWPIRELNLCEEVSAVEYKLVIGKKFLGRLKLGLRFGEKMNAAKPSSPDPESNRGRCLVSESLKRSRVVAPCATRCSSTWFKKK
jgi:hypothetical protein